MWQYINDNFRAQRALISNYYNYKCHQFLELCLPNYQHILYWQAIWKLTADLCSRFSSRVLYIFYGWHKHPYEQVFQVIFDRFHTAHTLIYNTHPQGCRTMRTKKLYWGRPEVDSPLCTTIKPVSTLLNIFVYELTRSLSKKLSLF